MKTVKQVFLAIFIALFASAPAYAQFSVDWNTSNDTGNFGFDDLGQWFADNGYAADQAAGSLFAQTGYYGFGAADADPFSFNAGSFTFEVVQRIAGNAPFSSFGFYTGAGLGKSLTEVIAPGEWGPTDVSVGESFGVYMNTPTSWQSSHTVNWFTDRAENQGSQTGGSPQNAGGDPQALIYKLNDLEWLLAWEDLDYSNTAPGQSDRDFNDAYLKITAAPVVTPEPASMALFGLGAGALGLKGLRRRNKKK